MKNENFIKNRCTPPKSSIKREIFQCSALLALIVMAVFGFFLSTILYYSEISKARTVINRTNHAVALFIDGYFAEIIHTITVLDENKDIQDAMALGEEARQRVFVLVQRELDFWFVYDKQSRTEESPCEKSVTITPQKKRFPFYGVTWSSM